jgi:geranylgeranyl reductase family protein
MQARDLTTPVLIVGGGPGGSTAALRLAHHGVPAVLVDKAVFPRDKVCGDALSGKVMRTLERVAPELVDRVRIDARRMPSWGVVFVAPGGRALRVPFSRETGIGEAPGAILPRMDFDHILLQRVKELPGITVLEGTSAKTFQRRGAGWVVACERSGRRMEVHSRLVLDASGANSTFARHTAGLPMEPRHHAAGVRAYYSGVEGLDQDGFIELIFLKELLPGYLWVFPLPGGRANVGLGLRSDVLRKRKTDLKAMLPHLLASHPALKDRFARATLEAPVQGMGLPLASKRHPLSGDGYMLIGDAGHLIDPFTGEGISHAMISGMHAADVAAEALRKMPAPTLSPSQGGGAGTLLAQQGSRGEAVPHALLRAYDHRVWKRLGQELTISTRLQQLAFKPWLFDFVVDRANKNPALADTISSMFTDLDLRAQLKKPGFYWKLMVGR